MQRDILVYLAVGILVAVLIFSNGELMPKTIYDRIAQAIMQFEGYFVGSLSYRNNNPGNLRFAGQAGTVGQDANGFAIFQNFQDGYDALIDQLRLAFTGASRVYKPSMSLYEFFATYAPAKDSNHPKEYAEFVAQQLGVMPNMTLATIAQHTA